MFSVKSGATGPAHVRELAGTIDSEGAVAGILIIRSDATGPMHAAAKAAGKYKPDYAPEFYRLQIVTVQQILDGERLNLPLLEEVTKKAQKAKPADRQASLLRDQ